MKRCCCGGWKQKILVSCDAPRYSVLQLELGEEVEGVECTCGSSLRMPSHTPSALPLRAVPARFGASTPSEPMPGVNPETIESYFQAVGLPARTSVRP